MVLPADNGRASVVMDTDTYNTKMSTLIENGPYQLLKRDPTDPLNRKLSKKLLTRMQQNQTSTHSLPKIHKADIPLRPIVLTQLTSYLL